LQKPDAKMKISQQNQLFDRFFGQNLKFCPLFLFSAQFLPCLAGYILSTPTDMDPASKWSAKPDEVA
jgi:hypothetical protein